MDKQTNNKQTNTVNYIMANADAVTITNQVPGYYKCGHCALHFKTRERFRAHEATCLSLKQIRARATFASASSASSHGGGGVQDLLALVQQLAVRLETAEHELSVLKRQQQQQAKQQHKRDHPNEIDRGNLLQWLNDVALNDVVTANAPKRPFSEWLAAIPAIGRDHLALVFQNGFIDGMCGIIASIACDAGCALCAYDEAPGVLFVYAEAEALEAEANKWRHMTHGEFERFINRMQKLLMNEFVRWQEENKERWHDPDFAEQYDANLLKVTGSGKAKSGGCSNRDMLIARMKTKVYAAIKRSANG